MHPKSAPLPWDAIDTVLLDMDGTLLDLRFDNWFWQEHIPAVWGRERGLTAAAALAELMPRFAAARGRLDWYCVDYWSRELTLDIRAIKRGVREQVAWVPGAEDFLLRLYRLGKRRLLLTNAHPETLAIKDEHIDLVGHLDAAYSTHPFGAPKEDPAFWPRFVASEPLDPARTLIVDDSLAVLAAARDFGIGWLCAIRRPDSGRPARDTAGFPGVDSIADL
ncbi:MAG TPA: GMP/IMP nucleotidase, partial [Steroidobacteraceae bacterium]|nr:GMP/IMP nucleotidase [Steroidobacteraceae bacterium]